MFDIGFWELGLIAVIVLLVVGPEQLPGFVRATAYWVTKIRRNFSEMRDEIGRELKAADIRQQLKLSQTQSFTEMAEEIKQSVDDVKQQIGQVGNQDAALPSAGSDKQNTESST